MVKTYAIDFHSLSIERESLFSIKLKIAESGDRVIFIHSLPVDFNPAHHLIKIRAFTLQSKGFLKFIDCSTVEDSPSFRRKGEMSEATTRPSCHNFCLENAPHTLSAGVFNICYHCEPACDADTLS